MNLPDSIKTITSLSEFKLKEKGSQFLAFSKQIKDETEAVKYLSDLKKNFYDASHHCYSYKIMDGTYKYSDDGEPNGTAGIRIYNAQNHFELTNLITVVVRFFGGTKLGVGPLGKAYYDASYQSLDLANKVTLTLYQEIEIIFDYSFSKTIHHFTGKFKAQIKESTFNNKPGIIILIQPQFLKNLIDELGIATNNKCEIIASDRFEFLDYSQKS